MVDFQGSDMPRSNDISDPRQSKRRRLNDSGLEEVLTHPHTIHSRIVKRHENAHAIAWGEEEIHVHRDPQSWSNVEAPVGNNGDDGLLQCCYGMLCGIDVRLGHVFGILKPQLPRNVPVTFRAPNILSSQNDNSTEFEIQYATHSKILSELDSLDDVTLQTYCYSRLELPIQAPSQALKRRKGKEYRVWRLNVIIYGLLDLKDTVGEYLSKRRMYLQDPIDCERNVLYKNPHMITKGGNILMTGSFSSPPTEIEIERLSVGPDLLAQLMAEQIPLPESEPPTTVTTRLFRHQKQALTFMLRRERGWDLESDRDIWALEKSKPGCYRYRNSVSGSCQLSPPPCFRGGLLADDMGLGKTLSMISLIAINQCSPYLPSTDFSDTSYPTVKSTLLIVPPPHLWAWNQALPLSTEGHSKAFSYVIFSDVIQAWEKQFSMHIRPDTFHLHVYHGQNRRGIEYLQQCDVVITTFQTLSSVWRKKNIQDPGFRDPLFSVIWHRVILDEAHTIQNAQSQLAQACCDLRAERRWAITGTPIQNKLKDFASILKFLQVYPYCDPTVFDEEISRPWQQADRDGFLRLKSLVRAITISRTKTVIDLPARTDEIHHLEFSSKERNAYNAANKDTIALFEEAISSGRQGGKTFNALTRLNFLRLFCNLGLLANARSASETSAARDHGFSPDQNVDDSFYAEVLDGSATCAQCGQALLEAMSEGASTLDFDYSRGLSSAVNICDYCRSQPTCHYPCMIPPSQRVQSGVSAASSDPSTPRDLTQNIPPIDSIPTKIRALVAALSEHCSTEKCVVFSYWTSTLDLVQQMLNDNEITCTRIDGKTSLPKRSEAMRSFQTIDTVRVILVSITCGGAGLDLTAASRAFLLEPHWNPMIEEQALCRVHRVGQQRDVTTVRYLMRDSFEEQVLEIQKRKKKLAEVTFGSGQLSEDGIRIGTLLYLKSLLE